MTADTELFLSANFKDAQWLLYPLCRHMILDEAAPAIILDLHNFLEEKSRSQIREKYEPYVMIDKTVQLLPPTSSSDYSLSVPRQPTIEIIQTRMPRWPTAGITPDPRRVNTKSNGCHSAPQLQKNHQPEVVNCQSEEGNYQQAAVGSLVKAIEERQGVVTWESTIQTPKNRPLDQAAASLSSTGTSLGQCVSVEISNYISEVQKSETLSANRSDALLEFFLSGKTRSKRMKRTSEITRATRAGSEVTCVTSSAVESSGQESSLMI